MILTMQMSDDPLMNQPPPDGKPYPYISHERDDAPAFLRCMWQDGQYEIRPLPSEGAFTIGASEQDHIRIDPKGQGPTLAAVRRGQVRYYLETMDLSVPVLCNGKVVSGARALTDGDVICVENVQMVFRLAGEADWTYLGSI